MLGWRRLSWGRGNGWRRLKWRVVFRRREGMLWRRRMERLRVEVRRVQLRQTRTRTTRTILLQRRKVQAKTKLPATKNQPNRQPLPPKTSNPNSQIPLLHLNQIHHPTTTPTPTQIQIPPLPLQPPQIP